MINVDRLLKKKGWTGEELGRLEVTNMLITFNQAIRGEEVKPIVEDYDFERMLKSLTDQKEGQIYNGYLRIHDWFSTFYNQGAGIQQQGHLYINDLLNTVTNARTGENLYSYISQLPAIMTEKQYKDIVESRKREILHPGGEDIGFNIFNLIEMAILYYMGQLNTQPRKKNPLKPLKAKLEREPVTDAHILNKYNEIMGYGYYTLEDGTRSDEVSEEEWQARVKSQLQRIQDDEELTEDEREAALDAVKLERTKARTMAVYNGASSEEAEQAATEATMDMLHGGEREKATWHYYENPPEDLNKWEILASGELYEFYPALCGTGTNEEQLEDALAFKKEFPGVVDAILKDMEKYIDGASSVPVENWACNVYAWEDLYKMDLYGFRSLYTDSDFAIFDGNQRAIYNGIAIIRPSNLIEKSVRIDPETGYYKAPDIGPVFSAISLEKLFTDHEDYARNLRAVENARRIFLDSYYFLLGYNTALELVGKKFKIEELNTAKMSVEWLESKAELFNAIVAELYSIIKDTYYDDKELQRKKLGVLKDILYPINYKSIKIPKESIEKAKRDMEDFECFYDDSKALYLTLCIRPMDGEGV